MLLLSFYHHRPKSSIRSAPIPNLCQRPKQSLSTSAKTTSQGATYHPFHELPQIPVTSLSEMDPTPYSSAPAFWTLRTQPPDS